VLPSADEKGRAVVVGSWLHTDGLMARLKNTGIFTCSNFYFCAKAKKRMKRN